MPRLMCRVHSLFTGMGAGQQGRNSGFGRRLQRTGRSTSPGFICMLSTMAFESDAPLDQLWKEYSLAFKDFDDLTLARWLAQTLGQLEGKVWRLSHPLVGAYRLAAQLCHEPHVGHQRLVTTSAANPEAACCPSPFQPLLA